jgi:hypothetical protein
MLVWQRWSLLDFIWIFIEWYSNLNSNSNLNHIYKESRKIGKISKLNGALTSPLMSVEGS